MNVLNQALRLAAADLNRQDLRWALVGGFAVSARAEPRFTRDIDIAVAVSSDTIAERVVRSLLANGYHLLASIEQEATARLATVRLMRSPNNEDEVVIDLLFASSGIEPEIAEAAEVMEILPGISLPVATAGHLIALKLLARDDRSRPQDQMDLLALYASATQEDLQMAREAITLIAQRGYDRGRDLHMALDNVIAFAPRGPQSADG